MHRDNFVSIIAVAVGLGWAIPASAAALMVDKGLILAEHNKYRAEVGVPSLIWSDRLAYGAQRWANTMAALNRLQHSGTPDTGENIAMWRGANSSLTLMITNWAREKFLFRYGIFPNVSRDRNWASVGHYTQIVWRNTVQVGCGIGRSRTTDFLVCWYDPPGNIAGQVPY